jgi:hypothetical protein
MRPLSWCNDARAVFWCARWGDGAGQTRARRAAPSAGGARPPAWEWPDRLGCAARATGLRWVLPRGRNSQARANGASRRFCGSEGSRVSNRFRGRCAARARRRLSMDSDGPDSDWAGGWADSSGCRIGRPSLMRDAANGVQPECNPPHTTHCASPTPDGYATRALRSQASPSPLAASLVPSRWWGSRAGGAGPSSGAIRVRPNPSPRAVELVR